MSINRSQASKLLNVSELALFDAASTSGVRALTPAQLQAKVERSRRLRDKHRDQYKRQRLASQEGTGSKSGRSGEANQRTKEKAQVFDEVLKRLKARLATPAVKAQVAAAKKAKPGAGKSAAAKGKGKAKGATGTAGKRATKTATSAKGAARTGAAKPAPAAKPATSKSATKSAAAKSGTAAKQAATATGAKPTAKTAKGSAAAAASGKTAGGPPAKKTTAAKASVAGRTSAAGAPAGQSAPARKSAPARTAAVGKAAQDSATSDRATGSGSDGAAPARGLFGVPGLSPKAPVPIEPPGASRSDKASSGYMSTDAKLAAHDRHFGEAGLKAIQGHSSATGRRNQGKRDHRGD
jgi:hypothetical protein